MNENIYWTYYILRNQCFELYCKMIITNAPFMIDKSCEIVKYV